MASAFPIVGVGASAGGLEAFTELLLHLPADTGMAFVLVQHLDPTHASLLVELLASKTSMTLVEATDGVRVDPNTVYVVPPAKSIAIEQGVLRLTPRLSTGVHLPVDSFLDSLARERRDGAVAVILSGTAADGAAGVRAIRAWGGTTMAQAPETAKFPGMPENAIATGAIDFVLPIALIAQQLTLIGGHSRLSPVAPSPGAVPDVPAADPVLADLLSLVFSATKADFTHYKQNTVRRRIARRMAMREVQDLDAYLELLRTEPAEIEALYQDLLIRVTSFFRQAAVFDALKEQAFLEIAEARAGQQVRFWVPGCATGEEAYSLAIAWSEALGRDHPDKATFQIFATDINQQAIDKARAGVYPQTIESDVSPERLARFFTPVEDGYRVGERLRETCVFARQDLTRDPPFSRLDLISLRNVLIYLDPLLQRRVLPLLHFALRPGGFLLLGESESVSGFTDLFALRDKKSKFYVRKEGMASLPGSEGPRVGLRMATPEPASASQETSPFLEADRIVLEGYAPAGVLVDADRQIRQFRGHTGPYLESAPGRASHDLFRMARGGLAGELRSALRDAEMTGSPVRGRGIRILREGQMAAIGFDVVPIRSSSGEVSFLVLFLDMPQASGDEESAAPTRALESAEEASRTINDLQHELGEMREYTRGVLEDKEASNEELRSTNEELQSANEELQSVNEELETTSEEVQSTNEELRTLNAELHSLNVQLARLNQETVAKNAVLEELNGVLAARESELTSARDFARAVVDAVREPLLVLDSDLRVVSASPPFYSVFEVSSGDTMGRAFFELAGGQWERTGLRAALERALSDGGDFQGFLVDRVFARLGRRTLLLSGRRIRAAGDGTPNVLVAIEDITESRRAEEALRESEGRVRHKLDSMLSPEGDIGDLELADIIDPAALQSFLEDFHQLAGIPLAIVDLQGNVLVSAGGTDICAKFHRLHPEALTSCIESDTVLTLGVAEGEFRIYKCNSNMWDVATPIVVGGKHMGNAFSGQFFFDDEPIDRELFRAQARRYGFDEQTYLAALDGVPRVSRRTLETGMRFFIELAGMVSNQSYAAIKLARSIAERDALLDSLRVAHEKTARLLTEESDLLARLQGALLDIPSQLPGVKFGHLYRSATRRAQVGGDFYDVFAAKSGQIGLLIGDVSGHGIEAARVASLVKDTVRAFTRQFGRPHHVLRETNRLLVQKKRAGFVSAFLGFLDPQTGELVYSSAGHPPPLVVQKGHASPLEVGGVPLGVFPEAQYRDEKTTLEEGCPVLLYTDGVTEVRSGDAHFGEAGLADSLERLCTHPVEELPALLLDEALLFSGGRLEDDAAMLAVRYLGKMEDPAAAFGGAARPSRANGV